MEAERPAGGRGRLDPEIFREVALHGDLRDVYGSSRGELLRGLGITRLTRWAFSPASLLNSPSRFARSSHMSWTYRVLAHRRAIAAMASFSFARKG
jgi:hypothetical protein